MCIRDSAELDAFREAEEARRGHELRVADNTPADTNGAANGHEAEALDITDMHEVEAINRALQQLQGYGFRLSDFVQPPPRAGEPVYPFVVKNDDQELRLGSLRELIPNLRKLGEKGMRITRFKGLGEMDSEELWDTTMNPEARRLLQVTMEDAAAADQIFRVLMGDHVEPRREFIEKHALDVKELDV